MGVCPNLACKLLQQAENHVGNDLAANPSWANSMAPAEQQDFDSSQAIRPNRDFELSELAGFNFLYCHWEHEAMSG